MNASLIAHPGRLLLVAKRRLERLKYSRRLKNGDAVFENPETITQLCFRGGPTFSIRDADTAAHTFREIFIEDHYKRKLLKGGQIILDVGANIGLFSYQARVASPDARIHAFEADPSTFKILKTNLETCDVTCHNLAVSDYEGTMDFYSSETSGWSSKYPTLGAKSAKHVTVQAIRLSTFMRQECIKQIDYLKIDIEGGEFDMLLGDVDLWNTPIKCLVAEIDRKPRGGGSFDSMINLLRNKFRSVQEKKRNSDYPLFVCE